MPPNNAPPTPARRSTSTHRPASSHTSSFLSRWSSRRTSSTAATTVDSEMKAHDEVETLDCERDRRVGGGGGCLYHLLHSPAASTVTSAALRLYLRFLFRGQADAPSARAYSGSRRGEAERERRRRGERVETGWCEVRAVDEARWF
ncbi:uncharacterized protein LOC62_03G004291 [Vanrija pseudolonga]|uniref:Uncharacterized protein n=1 Tax=Vanrija pseudolonga TaxID=143232 RepID=A0AAF0Y9R9_9TREE|nr:hypothetical protein LOC62_03G004291 [Vanrija pseudolonga]